MRTALPLAAALLLAGGGAHRACLRTRCETRLKAVGDHLTQRLCGKDGPPCCA